MTPSEAGGKKSTPEYSQLSILKAIPDMKAKMKPREIEYLKFMGVKISNVQYPQVCEIIRRNTQNKGYICLIDVGNVISASKDKELLEAINGSLLSVADGMPLAWYAKLLRCKRIERMSGAALMQRLLEKKRF